MTAASCRLLCRASFALAVVFLSGCAGWMPSPQSSAPNTVTAEVKPGNKQEDAEVATTLDPQGNSKAPARTAAEIENLTIDEVIRMEEPNSASLYDNSRYDFPITMNSRVEGWIDYFTGRGRPHMERYLARSSRYIPGMKVILKRSGMPEDLVYLALIESGFNLRAKSRARAVGPWQFIKATGTRYGLRVDAWVDERRDPLRSTEAAARYLKDLYLMFESWYLAASAYNAGEYKILRGIEELKTNNYWRFCETKFLRRETKDYVPKLIAAAIIAKNPDRYGFDEIDYQEPMEFDTVTVDFPIKMSEVAKLVDSNLEEIEDLNPELRRSQVPPGAVYELRVPVGRKVLAERALADLRGKLTAPELPTQYVVKAGDTLNSLSRRYRVKPRDIAEINNLNPKERLSPGLSLIIPKKGELSAAEPTPKKAKRAVSAASPRESSVARGGFVTHSVKRGESLWTIAEKYNVTVQELFRWNGLKNSRIQAGKRIKVKAPGKADDADDA